MEENFVKPQKRKNLTKKLMKIVKKNIKSRKSRKIIKKDNQKYKKWGKN